MSTPKERLSHLVELAAQGEAARPRLAHELSDLLLDWPADYPDAARLPFEALLEKAVREVDRDTRAALAARFARRADAPVDLLNELFFAAPAEMKDDIVARNAREGHASADTGCTVDEQHVLDALRSGNGFTGMFALALGISEATADEILADETAQSLALACKGVHMDRAAFSAIAVLSAKDRGLDDAYARLAAYDIVPEAAAERLLAFWRSRHVPELSTAIHHAAE